MQGSRGPKKQKLQARGCRALCCSCRLSVSSSSEESEPSSSERFVSVSSIAHAMVQERLDQMIRERHEARQDERRRARGENNNTKFIVMLAMEKSSYDPREDFRESIIEMITSNKIYQPKDLRRLLNCYVSMNSEEYRGTILEVFHEVQLQGGANVPKGLASKQLIDTGHLRCLEAERAVQLLQTQAIDLVSERYFHIFVVLRCITDHKVSPC